MKKLISTLLLTSAFLSTPALAWKTLNPTISNVVTLGDPHPTRLLWVILADNGPTGTGPEIVANRYLKALNLWSNGTLEDFGPVPEKGNCNRRVWIEIEDMIRYDTRWIESPTVYNACTALGIKVGGWGAQLPTASVWFWYY